ncbi:low molecular weight protein-tyrosine-phosphatase [Methylibium sp.]|uniref:low molecular weight protein-tyrosine-phosphatase n=1 Tax=Methylibium sp. TaxID=2067992 RepID=UPI003D0B29FD
MICMGNICRSPTAEGVLRARLAAAGLADRVRVDSAGTHAYHVGEPPDERSQAHAARRGYDLSAQRARAVDDDDFERFDLLLAMDWDNLALLQERCPPAYQRKLKRLMEFGRGAGCEVVPDPYYGDAAGFDRVLDLVEAACDGLIDELSSSGTPRRE